MSKNIKLPINEGRKLSLDRDGWVGWWVYGRMDIWVEGRSGG